MPWSHESQSLKIRFSQGPGMCSQCHQEAAQGSNSCHCFSPGSQHWTFYFIVRGRCLGHKVLPANSLGGRVAFLMKSEVWKLWNKYPKVKACLNKCEISQTQTPPWNSLVLQCLVLFIEDGSLIQGLRWPGREIGEDSNITWMIGPDDSESPFQSWEPGKFRSYLCPVLIPAH